MPFYRAISLLGLQHGVSNAFQAAPTPHYNYNSASLVVKHRPPTVLATGALESMPAVESILGDGHGQVNSHLAQAIYEWELAHQDGGQVKNHHERFSARDGIRLVEELAQELLSSPSDGAGTASGVTKADLVQEGMIALLDAMATYDNYTTHTASASVSTLEEYARESVHSAFLHFLAHSSRPLRLPLSLQTTLQTANDAAAALRRVLGREPTLSQVAEDIDIAPARLALYRKLYRSMVSRAGTFVSMEDEMEVCDPTRAGAGMGAGLRVRREAPSAARPAGGRDTFSPSRVDADARELLRLNSQGGDWTIDTPARVVAPLKDVLTDTEEINNPLPYTQHSLLNDELDEFLLATLTAEELTVIQLRFGLAESRHGGKGWTTSQISTRLGLPHEEVVRLASCALEKMRKAAPSNWDEDDEAFVEVSL